MYLYEDRIRAVKLYIKLVGHCEVRKALAPWWMFLGEVDLPLTTKPGTPQAYTPLQGAQPSAVPLTWVTALEFFEQGNGVESGIGLQQRDNLAVPDRNQRVFSGAPVPLGAL
jgi:hypothetical protein